MRLIRRKTYVAFTYSNTGSCCCHRGIFPVIRRPGPLLSQLRPDRWCQLAGLIARFLSLTQILQIVCTIYFVRIFVTFVCIFIVLRNLNRIFKKYNSNFAVWNSDASSGHNKKQSCWPNFGLTALFMFYAEISVPACLFTAQAPCPHGQALPQYSCRNFLFPRDPRIRLSP